MGSREAAAAAAPGAPVTASSTRPSLRPRRLRALPIDGPLRRARMPGSGAKWLESGEVPARRAGARRSVSGTPVDRSTPRHPTSGVIGSGVHRRVPTHGGRQGAASPSRRAFAGSSKAARCCLAGSTAASPSTEGRLGRPRRKVASVPLTDPRAAACQRQIFAGALEADIDGQGRVLVPRTCATYDGLAADALVARVRDHGEIWAPDRWQLYRRRSTTPTRSPTRSPASGSDVARHAFQGPLGIRNRPWREMQRHLPVMPDEVVEMLAPAAGSRHDRRDPGRRGHASGS